MSEIRLYADLDERPRPLTEICRILRSEGFEDGTTPKTIYRWINHGKRGVRLRSQRVGRRQHVSLRSLREFFENLGESGHCRRASASAASARAAKALEARGA